MFTVDVSNPAQSNFSLTSSIAILNEVIYSLLLSKTIREKYSVMVSSTETCIKMLTQYLLRIDQIKIKIYNAKKYKMRKATCLARENHQKP